MFSNYDYDIIIIGGGISGLFLAYKLSNTHHKTILIESSDSLGGRIQTIQKDGVSFEAGAARFHSSHSKLITLLHELNLGSDIVELPKEIKYKLAKKSKVSMKKLLQQSLEKKKKFSDDYLKNITFFQYLVTIFDFDSAEFIQESFGYDSELIQLNAHAALEMFQGDFFKEEDYYSLKNGMSSIIQRIEAFLERRDNIYIKKNCSITNIEDQFILTDKGDQFNFNHLICALPHNTLQSFQYFKDKNIDHLLNSVSPVPLLRIYAKYPSKDPWFKKIKRTITNNYIRHIIPIDYENGLIMISYTDGIYAKMWDQYNTTSQNNDILIKALHKEIKELYNIDPPKPDFVSVHYWNEGVHFWKPGYDINQVSKYIIKPIQDKEIYICGETFSKKQGWIEGSLDSCYNLLQLLPLGYQVVTDKLLCDEKQVSPKEITDIDLKDVEDIDDDKFTIDEVLKHDDWIIMEVDGEKVIYDISKWIPQHPGGSAIYNGIEANMYYKDKSIQPQSPTDLFNSVHHHKKNNAFQKYIENKNNLVIRIGVLIS